MSSATSDRLMQATYTNGELDALTVAEQQALLDGSYKRYDKASCSIIYWQGDDIGCEKEAYYLRPILRRLGVRGKYWKIPNTSDAQKQLQSHLRSMTDTSKQPKSCKELLIVHYGGHGDFNSGADRPDQPQWLIGTPGGNSHSVDWSTLVRDELKNCGKDVILILDCCSAALAIKNSTGCRLITLAACGRAEDTPGPGFDSFTSRLGQCLRRFKKPFSIHELFLAVGHQRFAHPVLDSCIPSVCHNVFFDPETARPYYYTRRPEGISPDQLLDPLTKAQRLYLLEAVSAPAVDMFTPEHMASLSTSLQRKMRRPADMMLVVWAYWLARVLCCIILLFGLAVFHWPTRFPTPVS